MTHRASERESAMRALSVMVIAAVCLEAGVADRAIVLAHHAQAG